MDKIISRTKENRDKLIEAVGRSATDILAWLRFLSIYTQKKLLKGAVNFEKGKDILVDVLLVKRGRYSKHFLNISFIFLIAGAIIGGPVIADIALKTNNAPKSFILPRPMHHSQEHSCLMKTHT